MTIKQIFVEVSRRSNTLTPFPPLALATITDIITPLKNGEVDEEQEVMAYTIPFVVQAYSTSKSPKKKSTRRKQVT